MRKLGIAVAALVIILGAAWFIFPIRELVVATSTGRGVLVVPLQKSYPETMCSANGATVASWPKPAADTTVALVVPPGGYNAVVGVGPCRGGCESSCGAEVRWGQVTRYVFIPLSGR